MISDMLRVMADQLEGKQLPGATMENVLEDKEVAEVVDHLIETKYEGLSNVLTHLFLNHNFKPSAIDYDTFESYVNKNGEEFLDFFTHDRIFEYLSNSTLNTEKLLGDLDIDEVIDAIRNMGYWCDNDRDDLLRRVEESEGTELILDTLEKGDIEEYMNEKGYVCSKDSSVILEMISIRDDIEKPLSKAISNLDDDAKGLLLATMDLDEFHSMSINQFLKNNITKIANHIQTNI